MLAYTSVILRQNVVSAAKSAIYDGLVYIVLYCSFYAILRAPFNYFNYCHFKMYACLLY